MSDIETQGQALRTSDLHDYTRRFLVFHAENPHVYDILVSLTREYVEKTGKDKCGFSLVYNVARWETEVRTGGDGDESFELNAIYAAFYARLIMACEEDLADIFDTRKSIADEYQAEWIEAAR